MVSSVHDNPKQEPRRMDQVTNGFIEGGGGLRRAGEDELDDPVGRLARLSAAGITPGVGWELGRQWRSARDQAPQVGVFNDPALPPDPSISSD